MSLTNRAWLICDNARLSPGLDSRLSATSRSNCAILKSMALYRLAILNHPDFFCITHACIEVLDSLTGA